MHSIKKFAGVFRPVCRQSLWNTTYRTHRLMCTNDSNGKSVGAPQISFVDTPPSFDRIPQGNLEIDWDKELELDEQENIGKIYILITVHDVF